MTNPTEHINQATTITKNQVLNEVKTSNTECLPLTVTADLIWLQRNENLVDMIFDKVFDNSILNTSKFNNYIVWRCSFARSINLCSKQLKTCPAFQMSFHKNTFVIKHMLLVKPAAQFILCDVAFAKNHNILEHPNKAHA